MGELKVEQVEEIIKQLRLVDLRPKMYIADQNPLGNFLSGFYIALRALVPDSSEDGLFEQVVQDHGWQPTNIDITIQMRDKGMDNDSILHEMISIHIETWQKRLERLKS